MERKTILSSDRKYRYALWREWDMSNDLIAKMPGYDRTHEFLNVIGLNPSTADETKDDPTIRRCIDFAQRFGFGALCMTNLFAYRATYPRELLQVNDPVGRDNLAHLVGTVADENCGMVIAAWGRSVPIVAERAVFTVELLRRFREIHCLGINRDGSPKHPLYLSADTLDSICATHRPIENKPEVIVHPAGKFPVDGDHTQFAEMKIITQAKYNEQGDTVPACIEEHGVRLFSLSPKSQDHAVEINAIIDLIVAQCLDVSAPTQQLKGTKPLVLYFENELDREAFIKLTIKREGMKCVKL